MQVKAMQVLPSDRREITPFIEQWHYSQSINGCMSTYCFKLVHNGEMIGAAFFGRLAMHNQYKRFSTVEADVIELRRLCCIDDTPKNTESYFIGKMLNWLHRNTEIKIVVSYADAEYDHTGVIYQATNFIKLDFRKGAKVINLNGKLYHDKAIRTKYKGVLKPYARRLVEALKDGTAFYQDTKGKYTYVYYLDKKTRKAATLPTIGN